MVGIRKPAQAVSCSSCGHEVVVPDPVWAELLERIEDDYPDLRWGRGRKARQLIGGMDLDFVYGRKLPRCGGCDEELEAAQEVETGDERELTCPACQAVHHAYRAPDWLKAQSTTVAQVFVLGDEGEPAGSDGAWYVRFEGTSRKLAALEAERQKELEGLEQERKTCCPRCSSRSWQQGRACSTCGYKGTLTQWVVVALVATAVVAGSSVAAHHVLVVRPEGARAQARVQVQGRQDRACDPVREHDPRRSARPSKAQNEAVVREARKVSLQWGATVVSALGRELEAGTACVIEYEAVAQAGQIQSFVLHVGCGDGLRYSTADLPAGADVRCRPWQGVGMEPDTFELDLWCEERRPAKGLPHVKVDSRKGRASLWHDDPPFRVELAFDDRRDGLWRGEPLFEGSFTFDRPIHRRAKVVHVHGQAPTEVGRDCMVHVVPTMWTDSPCRARIDCEGGDGGDGGNAHDGGRGDDDGMLMLYGGFAQGYTSCEIRDGAPLVAVDQGPTAADGDAMVQIELNAGTAVVGDRNPGYTVTLALDHPLDDQTQ